MADDVLMVDCKTCGTPFKAPIQMDRRNFDEPTNTMRGNSYDCPQGDTNTYDKADHYFA